MCFQGYSHICTKVNKAVGDCVYVSVCLLFCFGQECLSNCLLHQRMHNRNRNSQSRFRLVQLFILLLRCTEREREREEGEGWRRGEAERKERREEEGERVKWGVGSWCFLRKAALEMEYVCEPSGSFYSLFHQPASHNLTHLFLPPLPFFLSPSFAPFDLSSSFISAQSLLLNSSLFTSSAALYLLYLLLSLSFSLLFLMTLYPHPTLRSLSQDEPDHHGSQNSRDSWGYYTHQAYKLSCSHSWPWIYCMWSLPLLNPLVGGYIILVTFHPTLHWPLWRCTVKDKSSSGFFKPFHLSVSRNLIFCLLSLTIVLLHFCCDLPVHTPFF